MNLLKNLFETVIGASDSQTDCVTYRGSGEHDLFNLDHATFGARFLLSSVHVANTGESREIMLTRFTEILVSWHMYLFGVVV